MYSPDGESVFRCVAGAERRRACCTSTVQHASEDSLTGAGGAPATIVSPGVTLGPVTRSECASPSSFQRVVQQTREPGTCKRDPSCGHILPRAQILRIQRERTVSGLNRRSVGRLLRSLEALVYPHRLIGNPRQGLVGSRQRFFGGNCSRSALARPQEVVP